MKPENRQHERINNGFVLFSNNRVSLGKIQHFVSDNTFLGRHSTNEVSECIGEVNKSLLGSRMNVDHTLFVRSAVTYSYSTA